MLGRCNLKTNVTSEEYAAREEESNRLFSVLGISSKKWSGEAPETADGMRTLKAFDLHSEDITIAKRMPIDRPACQKAASTA